MRNRYSARSTQFRKPIIKDRYLFLLAFIVSHAVYSQDSTKTLTWSGYVEAYYSYDFNRPADGNKAPFIYSFNRHNEVNVNLGFLKAAYQSQTLRANLALMTGTYANTNLSNEPGVLKNILEGNAGVRLSQKAELWIDAGIFTSHIGFESAIGKDSWNLTRSLVADNTPYYESGVKISYTTSNGQWFVSGMILNGWQRMQRLEGNSLPSFGTQLTFRPADGLLFNSSTFIGTDSPDSARLMRYFHNSYAIVQFNRRLGLTLGFDYGIQQSAPHSEGYDDWWAPIAIARLTITDRLSMDVRAEYYADETGIIIATGTPNGFKTTGLSANLDYKITDNALWRLEFRNFNSKDAIFTRESEAVKSNSFITTSLAIGF
ncbi:porin [Chryseolinea sp. T2]|uniref:porin n=1 Tax=Chryseolinea sp. T2 TaxID=3129255 RepID=UPI003078A023